MMDDPDEILDENLFEEGDPEREFQEVEEDAY